MPIIKVPQPMTAPDNRITVLAFRNRFTHAEKVAMEEAAINSAEIRVYLADLAASTLIDLGNEQLIAGVNSLVSAQIISEERAVEILTAPIEPLERPTV